MAAAGASTFATSPRATSAVCLYQNATRNLDTGRSAGDGHTSRETGPPAGCHCSREPADPRRSASGCADIMADGFQVAGARTDGGGSSCHPVNGGPAIGSRPIRRRPVHCGGYRLEPGAVGDGLGPLILAYRPEGPEPRRSTCSKRRRQATQGVSRCPGPSPTARTDGRRPARIAPFAELGRTAARHGGLAARSDQTFRCRSCMRASDASAGRACDGSIADLQTGVLPPPPTTTAEHAEEWFALELDRAVTSLAW